MPSPESKPAPGKGGGGGGTGKVLSSASDCDDDATLLELSGKGILGPAYQIKQQIIKV